MVIEAGAFNVYRPPRRSLLSLTTELSYLSHSFCRSLRPIARRKLIAGAISSHHFERRTAATLASTSSDLELVERPKQPIHDQTERGEDTAALDETRKRGPGAAASRGSGSATPVGRSEGPFLRAAYDAARKVSTDAVPSPYDMTLPVASRADSLAGRSP
jgi:hypothetical protein